MHRCACEVAKGSPGLSAVPQQWNLNSAYLFDEDNCGMLGRRFPVEKEMVISDFSFPLSFLLKRSEMLHLNPTEQEQY